MRNGNLYTKRNNLIRSNPAHIHESRNIENVLLAKQQKHQIGIVI
uniref:Uncharacterized protein n=1 Tax=Meloidogyne enterolobii TaxID=390850 RepID=A0A6V7WGB5_MELEN|nr:unnamed protein product [Meloidogyne enterolobii]